MLIVGHRARGRSSSTLVQFCATTLALVFFASTWLAMAVTAIAYHERVERDSARQPVASEAFRKAVNAVNTDHMTLSQRDALHLKQLQGAPFAYRGSYDRLTDGLQHGVVTLLPHDLTRPPPPGLARWPAPGEVFLSPQLARDGAGEGIQTRYGKVVGLIGEEGLSAVDERYAYVQPLPGTYSPNNLFPYETFGRSKTPAWWSLSLPAMTGETHLINPAAYVVALIVVLGLAPSALLCVAARRSGVEQRQRRQVLMRALGVRPAAERLIRIGEVGAPTLAALLTVSTLIVLVSSVPFRVPFTDYLMPTVYVQRHLGAVILTAVAALVSAVWFFLNGRVKQSKGSNRLMVIAARIPSWSAALSPIALIAAIRLPSLVDPSGGEGWQLTFLAATLVSLVTLPIFLAHVISTFSAALTGHARRRYRAGTL